MQSVGSTCESILTISKMLRMLLPQGVQEQIVCLGKKRIKGRMAKLLPSGDPGTALAHTSPLCSFLLLTSHHHVSGLCNALTSLNFVVVHACKQLSRFKWVRHEKSASPDPVEMYSDSHPLQAPADFFSSYDHPHFWNIFIPCPFCM